LLSQLSGTVEQTDELARVYSRVNLQVQRFDRMYVLMTQTFSVLLLESFVCGVIVLFFGQLIASITTNGQIDTSLMQVSCARGMTRAFKIAQSVATADKVSVKLQVTSILKYALLVAQVAYFATLPSSVDYVLACVLVEVGNCAHDVILYPVILKMFFKYRKHSNSGKIE